VYKYFSKTFHAVKIAILVILILRTFLIEPGIVNGRSMEKTFMDDDFFFINKAALLVREPKRGDVIVVQEPYEEKIMIKRIIGLPGERISVSRDGVFIENEKGEKFKLEEPYIEPGTITRGPAGKPETYTKIRPHSYFVMGDNRGMSTDSRVFGSFHRKTIYGVVMDIPFFKK